jgi:hypothetical protein
VLWVVVREIGGSGQQWDAATGHAGCGSNPDVIGRETRASHTRHAFTKQQSEQMQMKTVLAVATRAIPCRSLAGSSLLR